MSKQQLIERAGSSIGGPSGWGECIVAHMTLDLSATKASPLPPKIAQANSDLGVILGEIRQQYLRNGIPDSTLGSFIKANQGRFKTGDQAFEMVSQCYNTINKAIS
jgi:hypothetical protein